VERLEAQCRAWLVGLHTLSLSYCYKLSDVRPLSTLVGLHMLDLRSCERLRDVQPLSMLAGLRTLNLSSCHELDNVRPLSTLLGLRTLTLSRCRELRDVRPLSTLVGLRTLRLNRCRELRDVQPLSTLVGLHTLDLRSCERLRDVQPLSMLAGLHTLHLLSDYSLLHDRAQSAQREFMRSFFLRAKSSASALAMSMVSPPAEHMPSVISGPFPDEFFKPASRFHGERTARERSARGHGSAKSRDCVIACVLCDPLPKTVLFRFRCQRAEGAADTTPGLRLASSGASTRPTARGRRSAYAVPRAWHGSAPARAPRSCTLQKQG
jgi:hypothetical protein